MSQFLSSALFLPVAPWPAAWSASEREEAEPGSKNPTACSSPAARLAMAGVHERLYVPRTYWMFLIGLVGAYLSAIFSMVSAGTRQSVPQAASTPPCRRGRTTER